MDAREAAMLALNACQRQGGWSDGALKKQLSAAELSGRDAALATQLCFGVLQNQMLLDFYLSKFSNIPLKRMEGKVVQTLRLGAYQMLFLTRIPHSAAVNSAVALANLTGTIQAQWAATLISFGLCLPLLMEVFDHPLGSAWKRFAEKCRIYPPQALPMQVLNSAILSITLVLPVSSLMYRRRLPVGEQFRQYDIPFCVLMALILLLPPLVKKRLYRWQGRVCLILYVMYLAAVLIMPRAGA